MGDTHFIRSERYPQRYISWLGYILGYTTHACFGSNVSRNKEWA
jgi:hypothetical protein